MVTTEEVVSVLLIEDDVKLAQITSRFLGTHGMIVTHVANGTVGLAEAMRNNYDVILLDVMLPGLSGVEICQQLRRSRDIPIIMVTARGDESDRVLGLEIGADDYLTKPFSPRELTARIRAIIRRTRGRLSSTPRITRANDIVVDASARLAKHGEEVLELTTYEFELLRTLVEHAGRVLSREQILDLAKGSAEAAYDRSIDVHISRLRQKLGDDPRHPRLLKTVRGIGYMLAVGEEE